jgi:hypothetical protein
MVWICVTRGELQALALAAQEWLARTKYRYGEEAQVMRKLWCTAAEALGPAFAKASAGRPAPSAGRAKV